MGRGGQRLTIIGDIGIDLVMGPISGWPRVGTESIVDRNELRAGGSAGNAALAIGYLGGESRLVSAVGNDALGHWLSEQFRGLGATLPVCNAATTVSVGFIHDCGERTFFTTRGHLERFCYDHVRPLLDVAEGPSSMVLLSGAFLTPALRPSYPTLIRRVLELGFQVALDTGWPSHGWDEAARAEVSAWVSQCDHVLLNELEVTSLAQSADLDAAVDQLARTLKPDATLVVKVGPRGAIGVQDGRRFECAAPKATIFDTIGAGDSFNAGYLLARSTGSSLADSLAAGCRAAVSIISRFPRQLVRPDELTAPPAALLTQGHRL